MIGLGFRAGRGGSVVVGVTVMGGEPSIALSTFLATAAEGDRIAYEPYHVAAERMRDGAAFSEAAAIVAEGRARQDQLAAKGLSEIMANLGQPVVAALLVNRAGWITDLLEHSLSAPEHPPVAEGLAVRDALRFALNQCGIRTVEMDEKSLPQTKFPATAPAPWRKEQKAAALAAWVAIAGDPSLRSG